MACLVAKIRPHQKYSISFFFFLLPSEMKWFIYLFVSGSNPHTLHCSKSHSRDGEPQALFSMPSLDTPLKKKIHQPQGLAREYLEHLTNKFTSRNLFLTVIWPDVFLSSTQVPLSPQPLMIQVIHHHTRSTQPAMQAPGGARPTQSSAE